MPQDIHLSPYVILKTTTILKGVLVPRAPSTSRSSNLLSQAQLCQRILKTLNIVSGYSNSSQKEEVHSGLPSSPTPSGRHVYFRPDRYPVCPDRPILIP